MPNKILITGGCGFIGSNFIKFLIDKVSSEVQILNLDSLTYAGNKNNTKKFSGSINYKFIKHDIRKLNSLSSIMDSFKPNIVINFAAESHVDRSIKNPNIFIETNILGTQNLITLSIKHNVEKFIQISTDEVYGDLDEIEPPFTEESLVNPSSPYSASKAASDFLALASYRTYNLPVIITRCSNNYGPYQHTEKLIPKAIVNALTGKKIPIYGDGRNIRDWIHVEDHCLGIWSAIENGTPGEIYNFGGNCEIRNIEIVEKILKLMNLSTSEIEYVSDRPGHDYRYAIDSSKSLINLDWKPKIDFDSGLEKTISWYISNKSWIKDLKF